MKRACVRYMPLGAIGGPHSLRTRTVVVVAAIVCAFTLSVSVAYGYDELTPSASAGCPDCHGLESGFTSPTVAPTRKGPHGGYTTGTQKCQTCHTVHVAPAEGVLLLPKATIKDTCNTCHDGTGGNGVYGVLNARGITPAAQHRIEVTNVVPGGDPGGGSTTRTFSAADDYLTCSDCHSPHDAITVNAFYGDRTRTSTDTTYPLSPATNRLLKKQPTSSPWSVDEYGSSWCGGCHEGRMFGSAGVINHPVETETAGFYYDNIVRVTGTGTNATELGSLGGNNFGYVMPITRSAQQSGHYPICQQCHEDARNIGDTTPGQIVGAEVFSVTTSDGQNAANNPRFQTFPHESENAYFQVEENDDLCLNCHIPPG